jgi:hypothetical protein
MRTTDSRLISTSPRLVRFSRLLLLAPFLAWSGCSANGGSSPPPSGTDSTGGASGGDNTGGGLFNNPDNGGLASNFTECATASATASLVPASLLFVIDRSGSMNCNIGVASAECEKNPVQTDKTKPSKWDVVKGALKDAIATLPPTTSAGITYFSNDNTCGVQSLPNVDIARLTPAQVSALDTNLDGVKPNGGTPLVGAVITAYKRLNPNQYKDQPAGNKFVVLLTDGAEDCEPSLVPDLINNEAPKAIRAYIKTFVVGVPGSEVDRSVLSNLAYAGGTPSSPTCNHSQGAPDVGDCHFDMTKQSDLATGLKSALAAISGEALSCEFSVAKGGPNADPNKVNVQYVPTKGAAPIQVAQDTTKPCNAGANGWQYKDSTNTSVVVCGQACDNVKKAASIDVILGCATATVQ